MIVALLATATIVIVLAAFAFLLALFASTFNQNVK